MTTDPKDPNPAPLDDAPNSDVSPPSNVETENIEDEGEPLGGNFA